MMYAGTSHNSDNGAGPPPEHRMTDYLADAIEFANDVLHTGISLATKWRDAQPLAWLLSAIEFYIDDVHDTDLKGRTEACLREREMIQDIPDDQRWPKIMGGLRQHDLVTTGGLYDMKPSTAELLHAGDVTKFPWLLVARNLRNGQLSSSKSCHQYAVEKGLMVDSDKEQRDAEWRTAVDLTAAATGKLIDDFIAGTRPADTKRQVFPAHRFVC